MPIKYRIEPNALTSPPAYKAFPLPSVVLDFDDVAEQINLHNPTIPACTAKSVLEAFREETKLQLANGNTINLTNFVSMVVSLPGKVALPTDTFPLEDVTIKAKASATLRDEIREDAEFQKEDYAEKAPSVLTAYDSNYEVQNWIRDDFGFIIRGSNIGFEIPDSTQGIFITNAAGTIAKQTNISLNDPSKLIITPSIPAPAPSSENVECELTVKARYTENGQLREGVFSKKLRTTNVLVPLALDFFAAGVAGGPCTIVSYGGAQTGCRIKCRLKPDSTMVMCIGTLDGVFGEEVIIDGDDSYGLTGLPSLFSFDVTDFAVLTATVVSYGRYIEEVCDLSTI